MESAERVWNVAVTPNNELIESWADGSTAWRTRSDHDFSAVPKPGWSYAKYLHPRSGRGRPAAGSAVQSAIVSLDTPRTAIPEVTIARPAGNLRGGKRLVNTVTPFFFEQSESYSGAPCATGCTITIPAFSQRAVYYRWKYLGRRAGGRIEQGSRCADP